MKKKSLIMTAFFLFVLSTLTQCALVTRRSDAPPSQTGTVPGQAPVPGDAAEVTPVEPPPPPPPGASTFRKDQPLKVGVILGPGGAKVYGHIGFLRELQKRKVDVHVISGLEWGALAASIYAWKGYVNDVEWQMMKLKEEEWFPRNLVSSRQDDIALDQVRDDLNKIFGNTNLPSFKIPFSCPAWNLERNQTYMMNRGRLSQMLPFCLGYPPLFRPYQRNVAAMHDVRGLADHMRSQGANHILYVNVLDGMGISPFGENMASNVAWNEHLGLATKKQNGVDEVISIPLREYDFRSFDRKKEIVIESQKRVENGFSRWAEKYGY